MKSFKLFLDENMGSKVDKKTLSVIDGMKKILELGKGSEEQQRELRELIGQLDDNRFPVRKKINVSLDAQDRRQRNGR